MAPPEEGPRTSKAQRAYAAIRGDDQRPKILPEGRPLQALNSEKRGI